MPALQYRRPEERDHMRVVEAVPLWWEMPSGAAPTGLLPRLFFQHIADTSILVEDEHAALAAFLIGFRSALRPQHASASTPVCDNRALRVTCTNDSSR